MSFRSIQLRPETSPQTWGYILRFGVKLQLCLVYSFVCVRSGVGGEGMMSVCVCILSLGDPLGGVIGQEKDSDCGGFQSISTNYFDTLPSKGGAQFSSL